MKTLLSRLFSLAGLAAVLALFVGINLLSQAVFRSVRADLTQDKLYTLSAGTRAILASIDEPITIRLFYSESIATTIPVINMYGQRVREVLEEYAGFSGGKLKFEVIDPKPFSEEEDRAVQLGLQGVRVPGTGDTLYFGVAGTNTTDDEAVLPFLMPDREAFLEYELTKLVHTLQHPKKPVIGLITGLPIEGRQPTDMFSAPTPDQQPWMIVEQARQLFDVRPLNMVSLTDIPEEIGVLLVVHPKGIGDDALYAIDQYLLKGGRAIFFVDPMSENDRPPSNPNNPMAVFTADRSSNLTKLFSAWGISIDEQKVVGDLDLAQTVNAGSQRQPEPVKYVAWLGVLPETMSKDDVVTAQLRNLNFAAAGAIVTAEDASVKVTPLVSTTKQSAMLERSDVQVFPNPKKILETFEGNGETSFVLAARLSGNVKTAFPDGRPKPAPVEGEEAPADDASLEGHVAASAKPLNVIVVADADMLADNMWVEVQNFFGQRIANPLADNASFVINALDNLGGSDDLISVRSRGRFSRPFIKFEELQKAAETRFREKEQALEAKLKEAEERIQKLQGEKQPGQAALMLSAEQRAEIEKARQEQMSTRKELRAVQSQLREDVQSLERRIQLLNMGLMPLLVAVIAAGLGALQYLRRRSRAK